MTFGLCNSEISHVFEKRLQNYVISKLITNFKKDFQII